MEITDSDDVAKERLGLILSDKLLRFNPYRVTDEALLDCAGRGYWLPCPSITQMLIFHFHEIKMTRTGEAYYGLYFNAGNSANTFHYGISTFSRPMKHLVSKQPVWMTLNGKHVTPATIDRLVNRDVFVSHAINCSKISGQILQSYRMQLLSGSARRQASVIRKSMIQSKLFMLEEVMQYPEHPNYLAYSGQGFDYRTPILSAMSQIRQYPNVTPPTIHRLT